VERNRKAGQNPPRVVAPIEEEEKEEEEEGVMEPQLLWVTNIHTDRN